MNRCLLRGSEGVYKPRSRVGLGKGSHTPTQALVGLVIQSVQPAYRRMGFVQAGGNRSVCAWMRPQPICASMMCVIPGALTGAVKSDPFPPPPHSSDRGPTPKFSLVFQRQ